MPDDPATKIETPATEVVQEAVKPVTQEAAPKEAAKNDWSAEPPQWAKDLGAKVDAVMEQTKQAPKEEPKTTVKETVETDLPTKVVAPKKPHVLTRLPKWL